MTVSHSFGKTLKRIRLAKRMSQVELAEASKLDRTFISMLERGVRQPTLGTLFQIGKALQLSPSRIVAEVERGLKLQPARKRNIASRRI